MKLAGADVTVTLNEPLALLPFASATEHATTVVPTGNVAPEAGEQLGAREPLTVSVALAAYVTTAPDSVVAWTETFAGSDKVGGVVSRTVTVKLAEPELPRLSLATQVTVIAPSGNVDPEIGVQLTGRAPSTTSAAEGAGVYVSAAPSDVNASSVVLAGTLTTGPFVSLIVTSNDPVAILPAASVAVQETAVVPIGNVEPLAGAHATTGAGLDPSLASTVKLTTAPFGPVASVTGTTGSCSVGATVSP